MFGENGWCRGCGVPRRPQSGNLVLQRKSFTVHGAWVPHWQYDAICIERELAETVASTFDVELRDVDWHASSPGDAKQIVTASVGDAWFDPDELAERLVRTHGAPGATCAACRAWRWYPLGFGPVAPLFNDVLPPLLDVPDLESHDVAASPEWFGDGLSAFRQILVRRELAELLVAASNRDFKIVEPVTE